MALRLGILLLILSTPVLAMDAPVVEQWWGNQYQQLQQQQQIQQLEKEATRCNEKLQYYRDKVRRNPNSSYYEYKLKSWRERCAEDAQSNPLIPK